MPARDYYLKDKTLETLCQHEQRPTHAHRCAGLACGARSAPGGWLREARRLGVLRSAAHAPAGRVPVAGLASGRLFHHRRTPRLCVGFGGPAWWYCEAVSGVRCVTVFACSTYLLTDQVIREKPASRGTETSAEVLVGPRWRMVSNAGQQQWYGGYPCTPGGGPMVSK